MLCFTKASLSGYEMDGERETEGLVDLIDRVGLWLSMTRPTRYFVPLRKTVCFSAKSC